MNAQTPPPASSTGSTGIIAPTESISSATVEPNWRAAETRVLHLINGEHYSGAERVQDLLAQRLPELSVQVGFACVKPGKFLEARVAQSVPLYEVPMRSKMDLGMLAPLRNIVDRDDYNLLHAHTPRTAVFGSLLARATGLPMVYHVHSPVGRDSTRRLQNWINGRIEYLSLRMASRLITVSHSLANYMEELGYSRDIISVVPNGVPASDRRRSDQRPHGEWVLGTVALFRPRKGTEVLIEALAILRNKGHKIRLRAVGGFEDAAYEHQLIDVAKRLNVVDAIDWTGFTTDVNAELTKMDLFVLPSLFGEGLPMVVLEAMAAGVPVVGTLVEGVPEAIRDGQDGVLAKPADSSDLASAIARIIDGQLDWKQMRTSALARHGEQFSDFAMAKGVAEAYRMVRTKPL